MYVQLMQMISISRPQLNEVNGAFATNTPHRAVLVTSFHWFRKSTQVVISHLVCDPTIRQPGFDLLRQQWSLLNCFRTEQGHCGGCRRKWWLIDTDLCPCGETQTMSHIVESYPLTILNGGLSRLHSADEDTVSWLTSYEKNIDWWSWRHSTIWSRSQCCLVNGNINLFATDRLSIIHNTWHSEMMRQVALWVTEMQMRSSSQSSEW